MKFLLLMLVVLVFWWVWKKRSERPSSDKVSPQSKPPEQIVACGHCGLLHPLNESIVDGADHYCSAAHRLAGKSSGKS